ncbi:MAG: hypothetical protein K9M80_01890 [Candidatus Marinimicrobia bacterium]|nr:hypothetical protein [Candidatus Neomarinimicrobiota bacterium]
MAALSLYIKNKDFSEVEVMRWCQEVETLHIKDTSAMWRFEEIKIPTIAYSQDWKLFELPCNVYRLLNVYESPENKTSHLQHKWLNKNNQVYKMVENKNQDHIYINYIGMPINEDGVPLILRSHLPACETYIQMKLYWEDTLEGRTNVGWNLSQKFSGQMTHLKSSVAHLDAEYFNRLNVINGDMIESIGNMRILNKIV